MSAYRNIIFVILCCLARAWGATVVQPAPQLVVSVCNDAGVPDRVLQRAEREAENAFHRAGVVLVWAPCGGAENHRATAYLDVAHMTKVFSIRIVTHSLNLPGEDFGIAFVGSDGTGSQADVFYSSIVALQQSSTVGTAELLGYVMSHELGHLVLGGNSHSRLGIMQPRWAGEQLRRISMGLFDFDLRQAELLRARLLGAYARERRELRAATPNFISVSPPPL